MKLYLVIERNEEEHLGGDCIFGVFSDKEKAMKVKDDITKNFMEHNEIIDQSSVEMIELELNEVTEDYKFFMYN